MGWEFAAIWVDDPDQAWKWVWRRTADDNGAGTRNIGRVPPYGGMHRRRETKRL